MLLGLTGIKIFMFKVCKSKNMILLQIHFMVADISFVFVTDKLPLFHRITSKHSLTSLAILLKNIC